MRPPPAPPLLSFLPAVLCAACEAADATGSLARRDTLASGTILVSYAGVPVRAVEEVVPDLRIGSLDGPAVEAFGDVRGIEAGPDGTVYVLDFQAAELRAFAPDGAYRATLARKGEGPGELGEANGMVLGPDGTLWVQDHGHWAILGLSPEGEEVRRLPMMVRGYGYLWDGKVDHRGVFWQAWSHSDREPTLEPRPGPQEGALRRYYKSYDPATETHDSVFLGESPVRTFVVRLGDGWSVFGIPFAAGALQALDPRGAIWSVASSDDYRLVRLDPSGDTALVLDVDVDGPAITAEEREEWLGRLERFGERAPSLRAELGALFPERKPVLEQLLVDDEGRLWVRRAVPYGEPPLYDVFRDDGEYLASARVPAGTSSYFPPVVRGGRVYLLVRDSLEVPFVVGAALPAALSR